MYLFFRIFKNMCTNQFGFLRYERFDYFDAKVDDEVIHFILLLSAKHE